MNRKAIIGFVLIILGTLFLLNNLYIIDLPRSLFRWPMILILVSIVNAINRNYRAAIILFVIGGYFLLDDYFYLNIKDWWPIFLIGFGLLYLFRNKSDSSQIMNDNFFDELTIFSGNKKKIVADQLQGGKSTTIFGGTELDLTDCSIQNNATIDLITVFGGTDLKVPKNTNTKINVVSIFGGFDDKRIVTQNEKNPQLIIKGFTLFGGADLKD